MTLEELKKLLDDRIYQKTSHVESIGRGMYISGYEDAVKLLWPLVELLIKIKRSGCDYPTNDLGECRACDAHKALSDLKEKLAEEIEKTQ